MNDITNKIVEILEKVGETTSQAYPVIRQEYVYYGILEPIINASFALIIVSSVCFLILGVYKAVTYIDGEDEARLKLDKYTTKVLIFTIVCLIVYIISMGIAHIVAPNYLFIQHLINQVQR